MNLKGARRLLTGEGYDALNKGGVSVEYEEDGSKSPPALPHQLNLGCVRRVMDSTEADEPPVGR